MFGVRMLKDFALRGDYTKTGNEGLVYYEAGLDYIMEDESMRRSMIVRGVAIEIEITEIVQIEVRTVSGANDEGIAAPVVAAIPSTEASAETVHEPDVTDDADGTLSGAGAGDSSKNKRKQRSFKAAE